MCRQMGGRQSGGSLSGLMCIVVGIASSGMLTFLCFKHIVAGFSASARRCADRLHTPMRRLLVSFGVAHASTSRFRD